ncbi:uncharacterized protein H6S33_007266 [Morchella sextelata]|uniref:uncharacterized protein n=1 Tax=Morchella sextelata TaxID=1174677 RepID=UPI001D05BA94|nr:uncharacterized protein H6S33_007266 [Morchella sextelata]KAH0603607.1 hypothetical protein H6S33_007266 [Morchella sextelata]
MLGPTGTSRGTLGAYHQYVDGRQKHSMYKDDILQPPPPEHINSLKIKNQLDMTNCNHGSLPEAVYTVKSEAHPTHFVTPTIEAKSVNIAHGALGLVSPNPSWALRFNPGYGCNSQSGNYTILQGIASNQLDLGACGNICAGTRPAITFHNLEPDCHRWAILQQLVFVFS